jgi:TonB family protein
MSSFFIYQFQVAVCLMALIFVYKLLLKHITFFGYNRLYLLCSVIFSIIAPLLSLTIASDANSPVISTFVNTITITDNDTKNLINRNYSLFALFLIFYIPGMFFRGFVFAREVWRLCKLIRSNRTTYLNDFVIVHLQDDQVPFSFFRYIFINTDKHKKYFEKIMEHEKVHVNQLHSLDLMLINLLSIFQWFNPVIGIYRRAFIETHEFLADNSVSINSSDILSYQKALLNIAAGNRFSNITNSFNQSLIKRRIIMMTTRKTKKMALLRYVLAMLVAAALFIGFACNLKNDANAITSIDKKTFDEHSVTASDSEVRHQISQDVSQNPDDVVPQFPGGQEAMASFIKQNVKYPIKAKEEGVQGIVHVQMNVMKDGSLSNVIVKKGVRDDIDSEAVRVIKAMPKWIPGKSKGKTIQAEVTIPVRFKLS